MVVGMALRESCAWIRSSQVPYGWLSTDQRRSFLTTSRWLSSFSWVMAGNRLARRSDSSHRPSSSSWLGSVSK